jgi:hypothetical protein
MAHAREAFLNRFERELEPDGKFPSEAPTTPYGPTCSASASAPRTTRSPRDTT